MTLPVWIPPDLLPLVRDPMPERVRERIIAVYRLGVDRDAIRAALALTPDERLRAMMARLKGRPR